ncbi:SH3 domain-containing RING finger protein 3-like [Pomacea canaliculata]|uniref:SH3 domain-containing RING finger protein 3-like n=1 Tax=Pomacea canaliculata TaxID=400727 RepID=UPI000D7272EA|nr:SH3 domain-containing RING finger protein 3-like [Pomacea canaliculata]
MDEQALSEILECSVCLERLDHTSKVLPCQHTFCRRCLEEIVSTQQELRCPECRTLVTVRVEDLPPNILLVRLLEGLKTHGHVLSSKPASYQRKRDTSTENRQQSSRPVWEGPQPCARALFSYEASEKDDLPFKKGDIVSLRRQIDDNWYQGELNGQIGVFPSSYVQVLVPLPQIPQCRALYDFQLDDENEKDCLTFKKDEVITVIRRVDANWIEGRKGEKIGILPLAFVELNHAAKTLVSTKSPSLSQSTPPQTSNRITTAAITTTTTTTTSAPSAGTTQLQTSSNTAALLPSKTSPQKRHSLTIKSDSPSPPLQSQRHSLEIGSESQQWGPGKYSCMFHSTTVAGPEDRHSSATRSFHANDTELFTEPARTKGNDGFSPSRGSSASSHSSSNFSPAVYVAMYNYRPQKTDEVELKKGDYYTVTEKCQDGWFKGQCLRTGIAGVFPGNYVSLVRQSGAFKPVNPDVLNIRAKVPASLPSMQHSHHHHHHHHHHHNFTEAEAVNSNASPPIPPHIKTSSSSSAPPLLPRVARLSPASSPSPSVTGRHSPHSPHSSKSIANTHVPVTVSGGRSNHPPGSHSPASVLRSISAPSGSSLESTHHSSIVSGGAVITSKSVSSSSPKLTNMSASTSESHRHRTSSPHGAHWAMHHSMSTSTNITPPNVVMGASDITPVTSMSKDKDKVSIDLVCLNTFLNGWLLCHGMALGAGLVKDLRGNYGAWRSKKAKSSASESSVSLLVSEPVAHARSGSYPSDGTRPGSPREASQHRKAASLDSCPTSPLAKTRSKPHIRERYRCIVPYPPQTEHELELELGDIVHVHKRREDGWYKGTQERTCKTGLFPGSL